MSRSFPVRSATMVKHPLGPQSRAYYTASASQFLGHSDADVLSALTAASEFNIETTQRDAWLEQISIMRAALEGWTRDGLVAFEFVVPRMGRRVDVLVVLGGVVFAIEFKVGSAQFHSADRTQAWDYALDLKNFHSTSHDKTIVPVLVATAAEASGPPVVPPADGDGVFPPVLATPAQLRDVLRLSLESAGVAIDCIAWLDGHYRPTPTIIQAAIALYGAHGVEAISRSDASAINLSKTSDAISDIIHQARNRRRKSICFVTGVPGAGKTLAGLNIATKHTSNNDELYSVFLSGNGPLVKILCEALARDKRDRLRDQGEKPRITKLRSEVKAFIQNVHHFRDECIRSGSEPPIEHVALFDEAQRAWNLEKTAYFMRRKKGIDGFSMSEPKFLISCMDRHEHWAVVVCLVGGGQEINTGEAGIGEWIRAILRSYPGWHVHISPQLSDSEYEAGRALEMLREHPHDQVHVDPSLHLSVSMRSFRAEHLSGFVKALLDVEVEEAQRLWGTIGDRYPIVLTRDLRAAKGWLRRMARGSERYGIVVSSKAQRLKPHAIDVRVQLDPVHWFLDEPDDVRSSYYLEDAATEFDVQGLELDWACVVWDGDLRHERGVWDHWAFSGSKWKRVLAEDRRAYLKNAYRVLLTRARQGMVIVVPDGDPADPTRSPAYYDQTYQYLRSLGLPILEPAA